MLTLFYIDFSVDKDAAVDSGTGSGHCYASACVSLY